MSQEIELVLLEKNIQGVATLTLNQPDTLNALSGPLLIELLEKLKSIEDDEQVRAVILTGAGRGFCSGAMLTDGPLQEKDLDLEAWIKEFANPVIAYIRSMSKPVIAAVNGAAAGAGVSIALACDVVFSASSARYFISFAKVGLAMDMGLSWFFNHRIGPMRTAALSMTAKPLDALTALDWGLSYEVIDDDKLLSRCRDFAGEIATMPSTSLAALKSQISFATTAQLSEVLDYEAKCQGELAQSDEAQERIKAFNK